ncbi:hypothetical protein DYQ86_04360 [Acidobacteria bacterium AB60]|nr:hypothetical protein DYQ86_04360 [Acidobacteria bacterium AB60]
MQRFFSSFPGAWPGAGLLCLRLTLALDAIFRGAMLISGEGSSALVGVIELALGVTLAVGFLTPFVGSMAAIGYLIESVREITANSPHQATTVLIAVNLNLLSISVALLGPGAYSLDARLFGRREIIIPENRRPPSIKEGTN